MRVSARFGITSPVPFLDIHVERDNAIYLDPSAIRNGSDPRSRRAQALLVQFFSEVLRLRKSTRPSDHRRGLELLRNLHEPNQTRLGVSRVGVGGKAFGAGLADDLWDELDRNPAARHDALTRLEHLPVFLDRVGPDLISDLTTRVIFEVLVEFTHEMMARYPALASSTSIETVSLFDPGTNSWRDASVSLPYIAPHQLLLVPKEWVYWRLLMWSEPFYNRFATETIQKERGSLDRRGRFVGPSKKSLKSEFPAHRRLNNDQAVKYKMEAGRDLAIEYQDFVDAGFVPLSDADLDARTS